MVLSAVLLPYFQKLAPSTEGASDLCGVEHPRLLQAWGGPKFSASCISGSGEEVKNGVGVKQCWGGAKQRVEEMHEFKRLSDWTLQKSHRSGQTSVVSAKHSPWSSCLGLSASCSVCHGDGAECNISRGRKAPCWVLATLLTAWGI